MSEQVGSGLDRRRFLGVCSAVGLGQTLLPGALFTLAAQGEGQGSGIRGTEITPEMIDAAAALAGITVTADQKAMMMEGLDAQRKSVETIRAMKLPNAVAPAFVFDPVPGGMVLDTVKVEEKISAAPDVSRLASAAASGETEALAFATVRELAELVKTQKVSSVALTKMYLARLKRYDPQLHFVITLTEERALERAAAADKEIAAGHYRGPLHGIPWGGKDLLAVKGYRTTWGAGGFEKQHLDV